MTSPFAAEVLFYLGPAPITRSLATSVAIALALVAAGWAWTRRLRDRPRRGQALIEIVIGEIEAQIGDIMRRDPRPYVPLLGTLFLFLLVANLSSIIPGVQAPTGHLELPAALAAIVFVAVRYYGVRESGVVGHLRSYLQPTPLALPLNLIGEVTRTAALVIRLFGNMMSGQFLVAVVVAFAGLFVPVPLLALGVVVGAVQAYIFTVLAAVFIAAGIGSIERTQT